MPVVLLRHGRTVANRDGLLQGRIDNPLDEVGRRQATDAARWLGPVERVVSSPLLRARQTAEAFGRPVEVEDRFVELDYGDWDGRPTADVGSDTWERWRSDVTFSPPGGESLAELSSRVDAVLEEWAATVDPLSTIVVVTHVSPIKAAVAWALTADPTITWHLRVGQATITRLQLAPARLLLSFNETPPSAD